MENTEVNQEVKTEEATEEKLYTEAELQELLQKEGDRRVSSALKKQELKNQKALKEAQRLAKMGEQEKYEYELEQREKAILEKEKELALMENKNVASKILADKGLSLELVDFIVAEDAETMNNNIKLLDKAFKASVKAEVEKRMAGTTPKKAVSVNKTMTREEFAKLPYGEMVALKQQDPELYHRLAG